MFKVKSLKQITEEFINRSDKIKKRVIDFVTGWVVETFDRGRSKFLKGKRDRFCLLARLALILICYSNRAQVSTEQNWPGKRASDAFL